MVKVKRGEIWWADLGEPMGSAPSLRRPVLIVQEDIFNRSKLATVIVLSITSNPRLSEIPGNVMLKREEIGLPKESVINVSQIVTIDKSWLDQRVSALSEELTETARRLSGGDLGGVSDSGGGAFDGTFPCGGEVFAGEGLIAGEDGDCFKSASDRTAGRIRREFNLTECGKINRKLRDHSSWKAVRRKVGKVGLTKRTNAPLATSSGIPSPRIC